MFIFFARKAGRFPAGFEKLQANIELLVAPMRAGSGADVLCHNDFYGPNLLVHGDDMWLIDWEYAAMGDYGCDFGNFVAQSDYFDVQGAFDIMPLYFGRKPTSEEEFHLIACTAIVGWYWYVWAMLMNARAPRRANGSMWVQSREGFLGGSAFYAWR